MRAGAVALVLVLALTLARPSPLAGAAVVAFTTTLAVARIAWRAL